MHLDFALPGLAVISFLAAFYFMRWGMETNIHLDEKDAWKHINPGGGGV